MKKRLFTLVAVLGLSAGSLFAQSDNGLIGRARGAAHDCLNDFNGKDWIIMESVGVIGSCFVDGFITQVTFSARPVVQPCGGEQPCYPPPLPIVVATVTFGCDGEIISNSCY